MTKWKPARCASIFLFLILCVFSFLSCSGGEDDADTTSADDTLADDSAADDSGDNDADDDDDDSAADDSTDDDSSDDDTADDTSDDTSDDTLDDTGDDDTAVFHLELTEGCNPFATSGECVLPYPTAFFQIQDATSPTGVRNNYPENTIPQDQGLTPFDIGPTNTADGVSPAGPVLLHFAKDVREDFLTDIHNLDFSLSSMNPMALFNYETGARVRFISEMDMNRKIFFPNRYALILRPMEPMEMGQRHIAVLTKNITDADGNPFETPAAFAVLRDRIITDNETIESVRPHYEEMFAFLEARGYPRSNLLLAWDFMVASPDYLLGSILSMRQTALDEMIGTGLGYTISSIQDDPNPNVARIVQGTFEVPNFLREDNMFEYDEQHHPVRQEESNSFPFTMVIPKKARTLAQPLPLVVFGHGLFGNGREYLTGWGGSITQPMAEETGAVLVATDWIGLSDGDLDLIINEVIPDLNKVSLVTDRLQQSLINNLTLTELTLGDLSHDPQVRISEDVELIDQDRVYYYGVSLGGIQGSSFVSLSNRVTRGVLAVPGAVWLNMIPRSINWVLIKFYLDLTYPDPLIQQLGIALIQSRFDLSDPINLTRLLFRDPPPDAPDHRAIVVQESIGDCQVPNMTTEMLGRAIGLPEMTPFNYPIPGLRTVESPTVTSTFAQYWLVEEAEAHPPPEENIPPPVDNGVHSDMVFLPNVLDQVKHFLTTGEVVQYCDGPCDPD